MPLYHRRYRILENAAFAKDRPDDTQDRNLSIGIRENVLLGGLLLILTISLGLNGLFLSRQILLRKDLCRSEYAQLSQDVPLPFAVEGRENNIPAEEWNLPDVDNGVVALSDAFVAEKKLHKAQRYAWDLAKGIYFLHGHHNLHCIKIIRNSVLEFRKRQKQTQHHLHIDHCLIALREDIICNADDTPRYIGGYHQQPGSGYGQTRMCRDWAKLDQWAIDHSACYQSARNWSEAQDPNTLKFLKHCPDDGTLEARAMEDRKRQ